MSEIYDLSDRFVDRFAALDPVAATLEGLAGHDHEMTDFSPDGFEERNEHDRTTLRALTSAAPEGDRDRIAGDVLGEALETNVELYDAGEHLRDLNVIASPVQAVRMCFDMMHTETEGDWDVIAARLALVPDGLASYQTSLSEGVRQGLMAARRQAVECIRQAETWSGGENGSRPFFLTLVDRYDEGAVDNQVLRDTLVDRARRATEAYASLARFLADEYAPHAVERDAVGAERYGLLARVFNGMELELTEAYAWGWDELHRIERAMGEVAERILPGESLDAVIEHLETDPARGGAAMYYSGPSEYFTRPGRTWYPTLGKTRFPLWG